VQAQEWGKYVGRLDLVIKNGDIVSSDYRLIPVNLKKKVVQADGTKKRVFIEKEIAQDPAMLAMLRPYQEKGQEELLVEIGFVDGLLVGDRSVVRKQETNLGNLIAKAMREKVGADVGIMNSGGIRDNMEAGVVTYKSVLKVQPFGNMVSSVDLSAAELTDYLTAVGSKQAGSGAFAQFDGVSFALRNGTATNIKVAGEPIKDDQTYRIAINSYVATGGDGYPKMTDHANYNNSGYVDADVLVEYFKENSPVLTNTLAPSGAVSR
jgi:5'-nucleotidase/UDP-sugar diphosphatase